MVGLIEVHMNEVGASLLMQVLSGSLVLQVSGAGDSNSGSCDHPLPGSLFDVWRVYLDLLILTCALSL